VGTTKGARRRQELVTAAAELLRSGGFDAVRHRAVAERAGLPLASTTYYFASLDDLVTAAAERTSRDELAEGRAQLDQLAEHPAARAELAELVLDLLLGPESRDGGLDAVLLRFERLIGAGRRPYLAPLMRELRVELDALLAEILRRCGRPMTDAELTDLVSLIDGAVINALIKADPDPRAAAREVLLRNL
jgi:DNA-binding transcriptional regulator YbjK